MTPVSAVKAVFQVFVAESVVAAVIHDEMEIRKAIVSLNPKDAGWRATANSGGTILFSRAQPQWESPILSWRRLFTLAPKVLNGKEAFTPRATLM
jgi:hypothetical protein